MSEARSGHVGKSPQDRQTYMNRVRGTGPTLDQPRKRQATDELLGSNEESFVGEQTKRKSNVFQDLIAQFRENIGSIVWPLVGIAILGVIGYFFVMLTDLNREVGMMNTALKSQNKSQNEAIQRLEKKLDGSLSEVNRRLERHEDRIYRIMENPHRTPEQRP